MTQEDRSEGCPDPADLATYWDGTASVADAERIEIHLDACAPCRGVYASWAGAALARPDLSDVPVGIQTASVLRRRPRVLAVAAAGLLLAGGAAWGVSLARLGLDEVRWCRLVSGGAERTCSLGEEIAAPDGAALDLPDGTHVVLRPGARASLERAGEGERARIRLAQGDASFEVARVRGTFAVETGLGRVEVLGTRFTVRHLPDPARPGARAVLLEVEVSEGRVRLRAGMRAVDLVAGQAGFCGSSGAPLLVSLGPPSPARARELAARLRRAIADGAGEETARLASLLDRQGEPGAALLREALGDRGEGR